MLFRSYPERSALGRHYGVVFYVDYHDLKIAMTAQFVNGKPIFTEFDGTHKACNVWPVSILIESACQAVLAAVLARGGADDEPSKNTLVNAVHDSARAALGHVNYDSTILGIVSSGIPT